MAATLDVTVGEVFSISERPTDYPRPIFYARDAMAVGKAEGAPSVPEAYAAGEIEVRSVVDVAFTIR